MGLREYIKDRPRAVAGVVAVVVAMGAVYVYAQLTGNAREFAPAPTQAFATVDDGKTYFTVPADQLPPFQHDGKTAYGAEVFSCDGGKTTFVGFIRRYSDRAKATITEARNRPGPTGRPMPPLDFIDGVEVKRPGESGWVKVNDVSRAPAVMAARCPDGSGLTPTRITP